MGHTRVDKNRNHKPIITTKLPLSILPITNASSILAMIFMSGAGRTPTITADTHINIQVGLMNTQLSVCAQHITVRLSASGSGIICPSASGFLVLQPLNRVTR